jgi:AcrR family transcriptional regulator
MDVKVGVLSSSKREDILRATAELIAELGYWETTAEKIAHRAGVTSAELADLFADVEECMTASVSAICSQVLTEISSAYSADRSELDSGILGIKAILELMAAHPSFAYLGYIASRQMGPAKPREGYQLARQMLIMMMERLREHSAGEGQPASAASGALGAAEALVRREIVAGRTERLPRLLPDLVYAATVPFVGPKEALGLARRARTLLADTEWA